ncbi:TrmH family RNA methyltransferase [Fulvivirga sp. RKSG066]|uniref:RNA methyltransferase n=1 Tax=Fulvivirga aurantia TaxID=2529383 RepID=UPI0012BC3A63|nr:RNA methyltransferase [Fulvivirga aurantia]MTI22397.1 TrmH family RNA methyltransferase [Fulvivirga aurantia]
MRKLANEELDRKSIEEFKEADKLKVSIVLDNIRSLNNVGSAFRTSDAFLIEKLYLGGITGTPPHRDIQKTALGATESVAWEHVENPLELVKQLKADGYTIVSIEQVDKSIMLNDFQPEGEQKYCVVFGNEVFGVSDEIVSESDICLEIPQHGTKHSLNISVSLGIVVWDFYNKLK